MSRYLAHSGMRIVPAGGGYIDAAETIAAAQVAGKSICEYLEDREVDPRKRGRRDRIVERLSTGMLLQGHDRMLEVGAGTGMYLESIVRRSKPSLYEIYETNVGWRNFLLQNYSNLQTRVVAHPADGQSLSFTANASIDFAHAHGVFVYTPILTTFRYIQEMARVCRRGGVVVFDCYLDTSFGLESARRWIATEWSFPVVLPRQLLLGICEDSGLTLEQHFSEIHGASEVDYLVLRKGT
jgi:SAM-dependent methyltransferase